jgi:hypothetical protein
VCGDGEKERAKERRKKWLKVDDFRVKDASKTSSAIDVILVDVK